MLAQNVAVISAAVIGDLSNIDAWPSWLELARARAEAGSKSPGTLVPRSCTGKEKMRWRWRHDVSTFG
jgi:hypothetical protein